MLDKTTGNFLVLRRAVVHKTFETVPRTPNLPKEPVDIGEPVVHAHVPAHVVVALLHMRLGQERIASGEDDQEHAETELEVGIIDIRLGGVSRRASERGKGELLSVALLLFVMIRQTLGKLFFGRGHSTGLRPLACGGRRHDTLVEVGRVIFVIVNVFDGILLNGGEGILVDAIVVVVAIIIVVVVVVVVVVTIFVVVVVGPTAEPILGMRNTGSWSRWRR
mmetsp:Transcript_26784/g.61143  ORF Transcript_26784/g.61143 Transcript_26784/m.61143 type:complete len:221 (+) Transcript_26784:985-1647(+)